jgi:hypothetical protein
LSSKRPQKDAHIKELEEENRKPKEALACQTQELMLLKKICERQIMKRRNILMPPETKGVSVGFTEKERIREFCGDNELTTSEYVR